MASHLCLTIHLLPGWFHGRGDQGASEWPPSPLRAFQALVRAAANCQVLDEPHVAGALQWLSARPAPVIVAPRAELGKPRRAAVPNNDGDLVAAAWARGREPAKDLTQLKTLKEFRARHVPEQAGLHYVWAVAEEEREVLSTHLPTLTRLASHVVVLGWGIDLAVGHLDVLGEGAAAALPGERWLPSDGAASEVVLRVPRPGTLQALIARHEAFSNRLATGTYTPPPALDAYEGAYESVPYRRPDDRLPLPVATFALLTSDASRYRPFNAVRRGLTVAGLVRGATRRAAEQGGWSPEKIAAFVLGHGSSTENRHAAAGSRRFAYVPLPSLERRSAHGLPVVGNIRRVVVCGAAHDTAEEVAWAQRALSGCDLIAADSGEVLALLSAIPRSEPTVRRYLAPAAEWTTVMPVVLPGFDDPRQYRRRLDQESDAAARRRRLVKIQSRIDRLLRKSLRQAGWPDQLAENAELEWRGAGFLPGVDLASRYGVPDHIAAYPRVHVRLRWRDGAGRPLEMPGPLCIGAGRFYGLGLFAPMYPVDRPGSDRT